MTSEPRPPIPPFSHETAVEKVRIAEDGWNTRNPQRVSLAYTENSWWRNRSTFVQGRKEIVDLLTDKWDRELECRLIKELWAFNDNRVAVRFAYEFHNEDGQWFRAYGNENWDFQKDGLMAFRHASINDVAISEHERKFHWDINGPSSTRSPRP